MPKQLILRTKLMPTKDDAYIDRIIEIASRPLPGDNDIIPGTNQTPKDLIDLLAKAAKQP